MKKILALAWLAIATLPAGGLHAQTAEPASEAAQPPATETAPAPTVEAAPAAAPTSRAELRERARSEASLAPTLAEIRLEGVLNCGVTPGISGFSWQDNNRVWQGFDVAFCRALAAAVLDDRSAVNFVSVTDQTRHGALASGQVHVLARDSWTASRDAERRQSFAGVSYYDGQGFMVNRSHAISSALELDQRSVCVLAGSTAQATLADYARQNNMAPEVIEVATLSEAQTRYLADECHVFSSDISTLAALRATFAVAGDHVILPEIISKEPFGPAVRQGDEHWADVVRWVLNALIAAEEQGVTSANLTQLAVGTPNGEINRLLGVEGTIGAGLGLDANWAQRAIAANGNYGEIFAANIGDQTPVRLARGLNALWTQGGLLYALPFR